MKRKSYEDVKSIVESQGSVLLSDQYINNRQLLQMMCKCGEAFEKSLDNMNGNKRYMCNKCSDKIVRKNKTIPYSIIKTNIEREGYRLITKEIEYINTENKIEVMCPKGHSYKVMYNSFISNKRRCSKCYRERTRERLLIPYEEIAKCIESIGYNLHTKQEEYIDTKSKIKVTCDKGHTYTTRVNTIRSGKRCKKCSSKNRGEKSRIPYETLKKYVESEGYKLITSKEDYTVTHESYIFQCDKSHDPYMAKMSDFLQGYRCPRCKASKGEKKIREVLSKYNVHFLEQYKFDDCKFYNVLPFDFYLPQYNLLVEYDGKQHFEIINSWGGFEGYVDRIIRDSIKNIYARNNHIKLLRIPYFRFNEIEDILLNKLKLSQDNTEVIEEIKKSSTP